MTAYEHHSATRHGSGLEGLLSCVSEGITTTSLLIHFVSAGQVQLILQLMQTLEWSA